MGGHSGVLEMPFLPLWSEKEEDPLHKPLRAPANATNWKQGNTPIRWGSPTHYPKGSSNVERAFLTFELPEDKFKDGTQEIYQSNWMELFSEYHEILVKCGCRSVYAEKIPNSGLKLYNWDSGRKGLIQRGHTPIVNIVLANDDGIDFDMLRRLCDYASNSVPPSLPYRMLIQSYKAIARGDNRKAVVEAASALEIALTQRIELEFDALKISFGKKIMEKYRMLNGLFELARLLNISLPEKDYKSNIIEPRNAIVHKGKFPDSRFTQTFVSEVARLLSHLIPDIPGWI